MIAIFEFLIVAALWGGSFLFVRLAVPEFGPIPLIALRSSTAALLLVPLVAFNGSWARVKTAIQKTWILGITTAAIPFVLLAYATQKTSAGFGAILNSTAPFFTAIIGALWLKERLKMPQLLGLLIGFTGVVILVQGKLSFSSDDLGKATLAALTATLLYGFSVNYTKKNLAEISPILITAVSQVVSALVLIPLTIFSWPEQMPSKKAWLSVIAAGWISTAFAFVLFYRLIARVGTTRAIIVTFFIPIFGMLWGTLFLNERITSSMVLGTLTILLGTALSVGFIGLKRPD